MIIIYVLKMHGQICTKLELELELEKKFIRQKQIQAGNNVINDTYRVFYVGRPLQRR